MMSVPYSEMDWFNITNDHNKNKHIWKKSNMEK